MNRTPSAKEGTTAILEEEFNSASQVVVVVVDTPVPTIKAEQEETRVPAAEIVVTASQPEPNGYVPATTSRAQDGFSVGKWETDLFDCFTHCVPNCFMATFFPCVSVARISAKLNIMTYRWALTALLVLALVDVMSTQVKSYKPNSCDFGPPEDTLPAYIR